jgi:hypothetical protein
VEVRYALRRALDSPFEDVTGNQELCMRSCGTTEHPLHHLHCRSNHISRTKRHTSVNKCVGNAVREVCGEVQMEVSQWGVGIRADMVAILPDGPGVPEAIDVSITTVRVNEKVATQYKWPTDAAVKAAVELDKARPKGDAKTPFFWEDHRKETPHPDVIFNMKLRRMAFNESVMKAIAMSERGKVKKYHDAGADVRPFVLSAGGAAGLYALDLVRVLTKNHPDVDEEDLREMFMFRERLYGRLSVILVRFASRMAMHSSRSALKGGIWA